MNDITDTQETQQLQPVTLEQALESLMRAAKSAGFRVNVTIYGPGDKTIKQ